MEQNDHDLLIKLESSVNTLVEKVGKLEENDVRMQEKIERLDDKYAIKRS